MFTSKEFRGIARAKLRGHWGRSVLVSFLAALLGGISYGSSSGFNGANSGYNMGASQGQEINSIGDIFTAAASSLSEFLHTEISASALTIVFIAVCFINLAFFIVGCAIELGHDRYYTDLVLNNTADDVGVLFSRFDIFGKALWLRIYMSLKIFAWTLLFVIPGIVASYRYALAPYIMAENPAISAHDAVEQSKALMQGHKGRLFCLGFSFIGWAIFSALTLGIGGLWLTPYMSAATAAFYIDRTGRGIPLVSQPE